MLASGIIPLPSLVLKIDERRVKSTLEKSNQTTLLSLFVVRLVIESRISSSSFKSESESESESEWKFQTQTEACHRDR